MPCKAFKDAYFKRSGKQYQPYVKKKANNEGKNDETPVIGSFVNASYDIKPEERFVSIALANIKGGKGWFNNQEILMDTCGCQSAIDENFAREQLGLEIFRDESRSADDVAQGVGGTVRFEYYVETLLNICGHNVPFRLYLVKNLPRPILLSNAALQRLGAVFDTRAGTITFADWDEKLDLLPTCRTAYATLTTYTGEARSTMMPMVMSPKKATSVWAVLTNLSLFAFVSTACLSLLKLGTANTSAAQVTATFSEAPLQPPDILTNLQPAETFASRSHSTQLDHVLYAMGAIELGQNVPPSYPMADSDDISRRS